MACVVKASVIAVATAGGGKLGLRNRAGGLLAAVKSDPSRRSIGASGRDRGLLIVRRKGG